jgi:hypothetical protein
MILVGIDDTDTLDDPGTNHLARDLAGELADAFCVRRITRHQLLQDPRIPCTKKNGCAALAIESLVDADPATLAPRIEDRLRAWCPLGSDPGLAIAHTVPDELVVFGRDCQARVVTQADARGLAARHGIHLVGLGGTEAGVIGALAAVGLAHTGDDGRVVYVGGGGEARGDRLDVSGVVDVAAVLGRGVDEVLDVSDGVMVRSGRVELGKRLRPNLRGGRVVLFVSPSQRADCEWMAERRP